MKRGVLVFVAACVLLPDAAFSQALTSLSSLRVGYNTRKASTAPTGELKAQIDDVDRQIAEAPTRDGPATSSGTICSRPRARLCRIGCTCRPATRPRAAIR